VYTEKRALIITEKDEPLESTAQSIKNCLHDFSVKICSVNDFAGTDILPAQIFFLGCNSPNPANFSYLEDMLSHINLVSRKCGIFSSDKKSLEYLAGILKDCEADLGKPFLITNENDKPAIENWLKGIKG
jgi:hypothetical protein